MFHTSFPSLNSDKILILRSRFFSGLPSDHLCRKCFLSRKDLVQKEKPVLIIKANVFHFFPPSSQFEGLIVRPVLAISLKSEE